MSEEPNSSRGDNELRGLLKDRFRPNVALGEKRVLRWKQMGIQFLLPEGQNVNSGKDLLSQEVISGEEGVLWINQTGVSF